MKTTTNSATGIVSKSDTETTVMTARDAVSPINAETLKSLGVKTKSTAAKTIEQAGGFVPGNASKEFLSLAASIVDENNASNHAKRKIALSLALIEESGEYRRMTDKNGKHFKSAQSLFAAMFPFLAQQSVRNYLNAARTFYIPQMRGTLDERLIPIAELEPSTAQFACGAMNDETIAPFLPDALKETMGNSDRLKQGALRKAVALAKERANPAEPADRHEDGTSPTAASDAENGHKMAVEATRVNIRRLMRPDPIDGEYHFTVGEEHMTDFLKMVKDYSTDPASAQTFFEALYQILHQ